jgi:hypothetical protein
MRWWSWKNLFFYTCVIKIFLASPAELYLAVNGFLDSLIYFVRALTEIPARKLIPYFMLFLLYHVIIFASRALNGLLKELPEATTSMKFLLVLQITLIFVNIFSMLDLKILSSV